MSKRRRETEGDQDVESLSLNKDQILLLEQLNETGLPEHLKPLGPLLQQIKAIHDSRHLASHQRPLKVCIILVDIDIGAKATNLPRYVIYDVLLTLYPHRLAKQPSLTDQWRSPRILVSTITIQMMVTFLL